MLTTILPEAAKNGLKRIATIQPIDNDFITQDYLDTIEINISKFEIRYKSFISEEETIAWIHDENVRPASLLDHDRSIDRV
jgi:hypothetical protein